MGRYYYGDIDGKFMLGIQSSDDPSFFGENPIDPEFFNMRFYYAEEDLPAVEDGIKQLEKELGLYSASISQFLKLSKHSSISNLIKISDGVSLAREYYSINEAINTEIDRNYKDEDFQSFIRYANKNQQPDASLTESELQLKLKLYEKLRLGRKILKIVNEEGECDITEFAFNSADRLKIALPNHISNGATDALVFDGVSRYFEIDNHMERHRFGIEIDSIKNNSDFIARECRDDILFGVVGEPQILSYVTYLFNRDSAPRVENGIQKCKEELEEFLEPMQAYFDEHDTIDEEAIAKYCNDYLGFRLIRITAEKIKSKLEWYARLKIGAQIQKCIKENGTCTFQTDW